MVWILVCRSMVQSCAQSSHLVRKNICMVTQAEFFCKVLKPCNCKCRITKWSIIILINAAHQSLQIQSVTSPRIWVCVTRPFFHVRGLSLGMPYRIDYIFACNGTCMKTWLGIIGKLCSLFHIVAVNYVDFCMLELRYFSWVGLNLDSQTVI